MRYSIKLNRRYNNLDFFIFIYAIMPVVDTLSGMIQLYGSEYNFLNFNLGQIYRVFVFLSLCVMCLWKYSLRYVALSIIFVQILVTQFIVNSLYYGEILSNIMKLFTPLFMMYVLYNKIDLKDGKIHFTERVFGKMAILYPATIIISAILGIGVRSYDSFAGIKGVYFSVNEICFVFAVLVMYLTVKVSEKADLKEILLYLINVFCFALLGTKSAILVSGISLLYLISKLTVFSKRKTLRRIVIAMLTIIGLLIGYVFMREEISFIMSRWNWQREYASSSLLDFLSSGRIRRIVRGWKLLRNRGSFNFWFGMGLNPGQAGYVNMEMDFFDLFFGLGLVGFTGILSLYFYFWKKHCIKNSWAIISFILCLVLIFAAGHVLFFGMSGMMLGLWMLYLAETNKLNR